MKQYRVQTQAKIQVKTRT